MIILCILNSMYLKKKKPSVIIFKVTLVRDAQYIKDVEECIEDVSSTSLGKMWWDASAFLKGQISNELTHINE